MLTSPARWRAFRSGSFLNEIASFFDHSQADCDNTAFDQRATMARTSRQCYSFIFLGAETAFPRLIAPARPGFFVLGYVILLVHPIPKPVSCEFRSPPITAVLRRQLLTFSFHFLSWPTLFPPSRLRTFYRFVWRDRDSYFLSLVLSSIAAVGRFSLSFPGGLIGELVSQALVGGDLSSLINSPPPVLQNRHLAFS